MNVILIMSDSFRQDHVAALGNSWMRTPHLDRFAADAAVFPNFRVGSFPTIPQRTDMFTGKYSYPKRGWQPLEPDDVVLPEILSEKGISTYMAADTPHLFRSAAMTFTRGFDGFQWIRGSEGDIWWTDHYGETDYREPTGKGKIRQSKNRYQQIWSQGNNRVKEMDWTTPQTFQTAVEWLTRNSRRENFFLYIDTFDPHEPWDPPRWARDLYLPDAEGVPYAWAEYGSVSQYGKGELEHLRALYAGECTMVDRGFGRLMDTVDLLGLADDTMIIFLSDHGHYLGYPNDGGQIGKFFGYRKSDGKYAFDEADVFVPLLDSVSSPVFMVRTPETKGMVCRKPAQPVDVMPTVLEYMEAKIPSNIQGQSLLPLLRGEKPTFRSSAITAMHQSLAQISDRRWLYGAWPHGGRPKLYDRKKDPNQKRNVLRANPDVAARLHRKMIKEMKRLGAPDDWIGVLDGKL
jgi:arylsulfatase A-like enzyme